MFQGTVNYVEVPQKKYTARRQPPTVVRRIQFTCNNSLGIRLDTALSGRLHDLDDCQERESFGDFRQKVIYRIEWPGYEPYKHAKNVRGSGGAINRATIVQQVAEVTKEFIEKNSRYIPQEPEAIWKVGPPGGIEVSDLILLGVDIVSVGSVQPRYGLLQQMN